MKRSMLVLMLLTLSSSSWADSKTVNLGGNFRSAVTTFVEGSSKFPGGLDGATQSFFSGEVTRGFNSGRNGFSGFAVVLTDGTPFAAFGGAAEKSFGQFYDAVLPLYKALDGPATKLASFGTPVTGPLADAIAKFSDLTVSSFNGKAFAFAGSSKSSSRPSLPGLD